MKAGNVVIHNFVSGPELVVVTSWDYTDTHYLGLEVEYDGDGNPLSILKKELVGELVSHSVLDLAVDNGNDAVLEMLAKREESA